MEESGSLVVHKVVEVAEAAVLCKKKNGWGGGGGSRGVESCLLLLRTNREHVTQEMKARDEKSTSLTACGTI